MFENTPHKEPIDSIKRTYKSIIGKLILSLSNKYIKTNLWGKYDFCNK